MQQLEKITQHIRKDVIIDYSKKINWIARPEEMDKDVDTFYLYPSIFVSEDYMQRPFADIHDEKMIHVGTKCVEVHGGIFSGKTNVFAPLYRQVDPFCGLRMIKEDKTHLLDQILLKDAMDSFMYYYEHYNNGKPFILAGHSQGTTILLQLMAALFGERKDILEKMVVAYMPGVGISRKYFKDNPFLKFAEGEKDTGVIVSWNTQMPDMPHRSPMVAERSLVINPLNWKRDATYAPVSMNKGTVLKRKLIKPGIADGQINLKKGVLECGSVNPKDFVQPFDLFPEGCYHSMDFAFYFENIRENVNVRIKEYFKKHAK